MTIILSNREDPDCTLLKEVWSSCIKEFGAAMLEIKPKDDLEEAEILVDKFMLSEEDTLILIGHGTSHGLLSPDFREYLVHENNINLIKAKKVICLWCYASSFCLEHNIPSFSTSMFISNPKEAKNNDIEGENITQEYIDSVNRKFHYEIIDLIRKNIPLELWVMTLGAKMDVENSIDVFNRQGLYFQGE